VTVVGQRHLVQHEGLPHRLGQVDLRGRAIAVVQEVEHIGIDVEAIDE